MDVISFRCSTCQHPFKVLANKAGRRVKCNKCGAAITVPTVSEPEPAPAPAPASAAAAAPPPIVPTGLDDEDEGGTYGLVDVPEPPPEEKKPRGKRRKGKGRIDADDDDLDEVRDEARKKKDKDAEEEEEVLRMRRQRRRAANLRKAPVNPEQWQTVRFGLVFLASGMCVWMGAYFLHLLFVFLGATAPSQYAYIAANELISADQIPKVGEPYVMDKARFMIGLVAGAEYIDFGLWLVRITQFLTMVQLGLTITGYVFCLAVPAGNGARGVVMALIGVAAVNFILVLVFKLLPSASAISYTMIPYLVPEVAMLGVNTGRIDPIHVAWGDAPFWECLIAMFFTMVAYAEMVLIAIFLRCVALSLKMEYLQETAKGMIELALGTAFIQLAYLLLANSGTTEVLLGLLRIVYVLGVGFFTGQLIWFTIVLFRSRTWITKKLRDL